MVSFNSTAFYTLITVSFDFILRRQMLNTERRDVLMPGTGIRGLWDHSFQNPAKLNHIKILLKSLY
jgi:hypothetical protein